MDLRQKIMTLSQAAELREKWRQQGETVIFTNGVFDILHAGHVQYLTEARKLGDHLILGLNSDSSVKKIKGPERPVQKEQDRAIILAGLWAVDVIILFETETPIDLITTLKPDILVKGGDYTFDEIVGAPEVTKAGGEVRTIRFVEGRSTTNIIQRIRE